MLTARQNRLATISLLLAYLTASTFSGFLHDHHHGLALGHPSACGHHTESGHEACCTHGHGDVSRERAGASRDHHQPPHNDECSVCRFLSHRSARIEIIELCGLPELSVQLTVFCAKQPTQFAPGSFHPRAPPLLG
jgi:hypothetical protein